MTKLTKVQAQTLANIEAVNATGKAADRIAIRARTVVLQRLEKAGLVTSGRPFAFAYHTIQITDAGRAALQNTSL